MTFEIEINGGVKSVVLEPIAGGAGTTLRATVDDRVQELDVTATELGWSLLFAGGRMVDVQLPKVDVTATVNGRRFGRARPGDASARGERRVSAPMPGRIVRVLVRAGDAVAAGQPLVVVEAMKMENELKSPKAGRVKEVSVAEGTSIEAGRLLVVVE